MFTLSHYEKFESYIPTAIASASHFALATMVVFLFIIIRYFILVTPFYTYFWKRQSSKNKPKLHDLKITQQQVQTEISYSILSSFVFAISGVLIAYLWQNGFTLLYLKIDQYGLIYLFLSFVLLTLFHEIYFYSTHRLMHHKSIFKYVHAIHHISKKTTPWASFSFHPTEAVIQALFLPLVILFLPLHPLVVIAYMIFMTLTAISNHLGFELIKSKMIKKYFISGSHHSLHHLEFTTNYGLYYCFMDQLFKTESKRSL